MGGRKTNPARRRGTALLLGAAVCLLALGARAQPVLNDTVMALNTDFWQPCGRRTPCQDPTACCARWGVCGFSDHFCGVYCLSGACNAIPPSPPLPPPSPPSPPPPSPDATATAPPPSPEISGSPPPPLPPSPMFEPTPFVDAIVSVREGDVALAGCSAPGWIITSVENAMYGDVATRCNSTLTYTIVSAACIGQPTCMIPAVNAVFDDPCLNVFKTLQFGYRCQPGPAIWDLDPPTDRTSSEVPSPTATPPPPFIPPLPTLSPSPNPSPSVVPSPSPVPVPSPNPSVPSNAQVSSLWGNRGELFNVRSLLNDWSQAGYAANLSPIPDYPVRFNVRDSKYKARGDGKTDDWKAISAAIADASAEAKRTRSGVAVLLPAGTYRITRPLVINQSWVVLKGEGMDRTVLSFPNSMAKLFGPGKAWAFGGMFLTIKGSNPDSRRVQNKLTDVTTDIALGSRRVNVRTTAAIKAGQWVRLYAASPATTRRRRQLLGEEEGALRAQAAAAAGLSRRHVMQSDGGSEDPLAGMFEDPTLQAGLEAALQAQVKLDAAIAANPDKVPAQATDPNATNPLGMDDWLLTVGQAAAEAALAENAKAYAEAADGTMDAYLYGENVVWSGEDGRAYPQVDRIRFVSRVTAVGSNWIEFERAVPYDVRLKWKPQLHSFNPTVQHSGFEGFTVTFPWTTYPDHFKVAGYNGLGIYDAANCWMRQIKVVNSDNAIIVESSDFVTVTDTVFDISKPRGRNKMAANNGHHALWMQRCSNVLITRFDVKVRYVHDLTWAVFAETSVFSNGTGADLNIDSHRGGPHNNLASNLQMGAGTRSFQSGGDEYRGAHSGANVTYWNLRTSRSSAIQVPACDFGPMLYFAGLWSAPPAAKRGLRRLAQRDDVAMATATAVEVEGAAAPAPSQQVQASGLTAGRAGSWVDDLAIAMSTTLSTTTSWCSKQMWRVDQLQPGKQLWPVDLHSAMVQARRAGLNLS